MKIIIGLTAWGSILTWVHSKKILMHYCKKCYPSKLVYCCYRYSLISCLSLLLGANFDYICWVLRCVQVTLEQNRSFVMCFVQKTWASMMTSMLMCWGTIRSLLWSTSSTSGWRSPPPVSRVPGWPLWTAPARTLVIHFICCHFRSVSKDFNGLFPIFLAKVWLSLML